MNNTGRSVVVVGAGVGGLVSALELAHRGHRVTVIERAARVGGKMRQELISGRSLDVGPTVLTMRWVFERIFGDVGERLEEHVTLRPAEILARHAWQDGSRLDLFTDPERSAAAIEDLAGPAEARGFRRFLEHSRRIYESAEHAFILSPSPRFTDISKRMGRDGLKHAMRLDSMRSMWRALGSFFGDARLRQLFGRYATYYGSSPFLAPATLNLIAAVELGGVWFPEGGMYALARALENLVAERGAEIRCGQMVEEVIVEGGRARGVRLAGGETLRADAVIANADVAAIGSGALGDRVARAVRGPSFKDRSLSALTIATVARTSDFALAGHNVFFSDDYRGEFDDILSRGRLPSSPTVYVRAQDRDGGDPPAGEERLFMIINAPALGDRTPPSQDEVQTCVRSSIETLERCGLVVEQSPENTVVTDPGGFESLFPHTGGAIYGRSTHSWRASMQRHGPRSPIPGLYLAGGSVHPGAGVPMAAMSGRLAASCALEDHDSTCLSPMEGMPGGTSTGSATITASA
jgi:1-hydroxycarotenoid 3,4-desaturase